MTKTMYRSPYETPKCKLYSIYVESIIASSDGYGNPGGAGDDLGDGGSHDL